MGPFSIWHYVPLLIVIGIIYGIYRIAKRRSTTTTATGEPCGVSGWLFFLVIGLVFLGPVMGFGRLNSDFMGAESQYPNLVMLDAWKTYKMSCWLTQLVVSALSIFAGVGLLTGRNVSVVKRAKIILWLIGPASSIVMGAIFPLLMFGQSNTGPEFIGGFIAQIMVAAIWTAYLSRSKRVRNTYSTFVSANGSLESSHSKLDC